MDIDETSKLWGMLHQTPYALSVAYQASLVLIEGRERPVPAKQVDRRTVTVLPFAAPGAPVPPGRQESAEPEPEPEPAPAPAPDVAPKAVAPARKRAAVKTAKAAAKPVTKRAAPARARKGTEAGADDKES
jgi:hypothetical protein